MLCQEIHTKILIKNKYADVCHNILCIKAKHKDFHVWNEVEFRSCRLIFFD